MEQSSSNGSRHFLFRLQSPSTLSCFSYLHQFSENTQSLGRLDSWEKLSGAATPVSHKPGSAAKAPTGTFRAYLVTCLLRHRVIRSETAAYITSETRMSIKHCRLYVYVHFCSNISRPLFSNCNLQSTKQHSLQ